ncbi:MAG TPA: DUF6282 family protein [Clostridia bacterium]
MDKAALLLQGAIDLHVHSAPSLTERSADSWEVLVQAAAAGMRGVLIKDHHVTTAPQAYIINRHANITGCRLYSSLCLNNAAGGLNPYAVEAAIRMGVDLVYLPTFSSQNHMDYMRRIPMAKKPEEPVAKRVQPLPGEPVRLLDEAGGLKPVVKTIIDMIADADIILGTGHGSIAEIYEVVGYAVKTGCKKICLTHLPAYTTNDLQELRRVTDLGVSYVELVYEMVVRGMPAEFRYTHAQMAEFVRFFGVDRMVFSTDFGQAHNPVPVEGMKTVIRMLLDQGFDDEEIRTMTSKNPAKLLGIE